MHSNNIIAQEKIKKHRIWIDSRGASGEKLDEIGIDFRGVVLEEKMSLQEANISEAIFDGLSIEEIDFYGCNLASGSFLNINLKKPIFSKSILDYCHLKNATITDGNFMRASFYESDLTDARMTNGNFVKVSFYNANLSGVDLSGSVLEQAKFTYAKLHNANLSGTNLKQSNLKLAEIVNVKFEGAIFDEYTLWPSGFKPEEYGAIYLS